MNMKRSNILFALAFVLLSVVSVSCYDEGGSRSNYDYRIIRSWQLTHCYLNGTEIDSTNTTTYYANDPGSYYYIYADHVLNVMTYHNGLVRQSTAGFWYFPEKDPDHLVMEFSLLGKNYKYTAVVKKLTHKELFYEYDDANGNHWRLEMNNRSSYY